MAVNVCRLSGQLPGAGLRSRDHGILRSRCGAHSDVPGTLSVCFVDADRRRRAVRRRDCLDWSPHDARHSCSEAPPELVMATEPAETVDEPKKKRGFWGPPVRPRQGGQGRGIAGGVSTKSSYRIKLCSREHHIVPTGRLTEDRGRVSSPSHSIEHPSSTRRHHRRRAARWRSRSRSMAFASATASAFFRWKAGTELRPASPAISHADAGETSASAARSSCGAEKPLQSVTTAARTRISSC